MSLYIDTNVVQAEIDRRYELAGTHLSDRHAYHRADLPVRPLAMHPLVAFVTRLVGGTATPTTSRREGTVVAAGRPRHP